MHSTDPCWVDPICVSSLYMTCSPHYLIIVHMYTIAAAAAATALLVAAVHGPTHGPRALAHSARVNHC
jgi:hypothetical protein